MTNNQSFFESIDKSEKIFTNDYTVSRIRKKSSLLTVESAVFVPHRKKKAGGRAPPPPRGGGFFCGKSADKSLPCIVSFLKGHFSSGKTKLKKVDEKLDFLPIPPHFQTVFPPFFCASGNRKKWCIK